MYLSMDIEMGLLQIRFARSVHTRVLVSTHIASLPDMYVGVEV